MFLILHVIVFKYNTFTSQSNFFLRRQFFLVIKYSGGILSRRHFFQDAFFLGGNFSRRHFFPDSLKAPSDNSFILTV